MTVDMQEADWVKVLNILANQPFKSVAGLIQQIQMQLQQQAQQQQLVPRPNGRDDEAKAQMRAS